MHETPHQLMKLIWNRDGLAQMHLAIYGRLGTSYNLDRLITEILAGGAGDPAGRRAIKRHLDRTLRQIGDDREQLARTAGRVRPVYQDAALHRLATQETRLTNLKRALGF